MAYSQLGQDAWVLSIFPINNGFFVDIGYRHPINISNTYLLELNGWSGIGVDPLLSDNESCDKGILSIKDNLSIRPKTKLYNYAIYSVSNIELKFLKAGGYSGIKECLYPYGRAMRRESKKETILVKTKTLEDLLVEANAPKNIHYISLDTEGSEYEILKVIPFEKFNIGCMTIEHNKITKNKQLICELLFSKNYQLIKDRRFEFFFVHKDIKNTFSI
jgi:FkbM family methyltransferase